MICPKNPEHAPINPHLKGIKSFVLKISVNVYDSTAYNNMEKAQYLKTPIFI